MHYTYTYLFTAHKVRDRKCVIKKRRKKNAQKKRTTRNIFVFLFLFHALRLLLILVCICMRAKRIYNYIFVAHSVDDAIA